MQQQTKAASVNRDTWRRLSDAVAKANRRIPREGRRPVYTDQLIVRMYLWAVWHDRPLSWAARRENYSSLFRPRQLPSVSQFCRRVRTVRVDVMIGWVTQHLARSEVRSKVCFFDGKALPVPESSRDPDARTGRGNGQFSRGYKLHAYATEDGSIPVFCVTALNVGEPTRAMSMVREIGPGTLVIADANYDSWKLYERVDTRGGQLFTPMKGRRAAKHSRRRRDMPKSRLRILRDWEHRPRKCLELYRARGTIERIFSALSTFAGGLGPLPAWVRRLPRVRRWVTAKIAIYHARLRARRALAM